MSEPNPPSSPEEPRKDTASFLPIILILAVFFLIVLVASILLLPDKGKKLLKLTTANPIIYSIPIHQNRSSA